MIELKYTGYLKKIPEMVYIAINIIKQGKGTVT